MVRRAPQTSPDPTVNFARGYEVIRQDALHENREPPPRETFRGPRAFFLCVTSFDLDIDFVEGVLPGGTSPGLEVLVRPHRWLPPTSSGRVYSFAIAGEYDVCFAATAPNAMYLSLAVGLGGAEYGEFFNWW
jgi:hypothetical protein